MRFNNSQIARYPPCKYALRSTWAGNDFSSREQFRVPTKLAGSCPVLPHSSIESRNLGHLFSYKRLGLDEGVTGANRLNNHFFASFEDICQLAFWRSFLQFLNENIGNWEKKNSTLNFFFFKKKPSSNMLVLKPYAINCNCKITMKITKYSD